MHTLNCDNGMENALQSCTVIGTLRSTNVPKLNHMQARCSYGYSEDDLRKLLANEQGTARRQELLRAIWRLSQQRCEVDSSTTAESAPACSETKPQPSSQK